TSAWPVGAGVPSACWAETLVEAALANKAMAIPADSVLWLRANGMQFISIVLSQRLIGLGGFVSIQRPDKNTARVMQKYPAPLRRPVSLLFSP
ncbi:hypothetical protein, partial [Pseudomonas viridiflava]|uniref:hypothetical protein n=1 Tax=Pseudomonas viridiflava TaxID=33069 RepID=UPI0013E04678